MVRWVFCLNVCGDRVNFVGDVVKISLVMAVHRYVGGEGESEPWYENLLFSYRGDWHPGECCETHCIRCRGEKWHAVYMSACNYLLLVILEA